MQSPPSDYFLVLVIFTAVTALSLLIQACSLLAMFIVLRKSMKKMQDMANEAKAKAMPMLASAQALLDDIGPKLKTATSEISEISQKARHQANNLNETMDTVLVKANAQIRRIDEMVSGTMDIMEQASRAIEFAVAAPTRRVSGVLQGLRVGLGVFLGREKQVRVGATSARSQGPAIHIEEPVARTENPRTEGSRTVEFPQQKHA
ncbi:MAG: hypothetical protein WAM66_01570 [Acidobacteriaceae bacterium]